MKKILLISVLLCFVFVAKAQFLTINNVFKIVECNDSSCFKKSAVKNGFVFKDFGTIIGQIFVYVKKRPDLGSEKQDALSCIILNDKFNVTYETQDNKFEMHYKQLVSKGQIKEISTNESIYGGVEKKFVYKKFPNYTAKLEILESGENAHKYRLKIDRVIKK